MSRTYRQRSNNWFNLEWVLRDHDTDAITPPQIDRKSKEGKKRIAKFHSDKTIRFQEPGPSWFRNLTTERPQRREAKYQLDLYRKGVEFEVMLNAKDPLDYWT